MLPTPGDVHVNRPLTGMSLLMAQELVDFIADDASLNIPSEKQSDLFFTFDKEYWFRDSLKKRAPGAEAEEVGYGVSTDSFAIDVWAAKHPIPDQRRANEDVPLNSDRNANMFLTRLERIRREKSFASTYITSGVWTSTRTGVASGPSSVQFVQWSDETNATPFTDVRDWRQTVKLLTGLRPNIMALGEAAWNKLAEHPDTLDRIRSLGAPGAPVPTVVTQEAVATAMGLEKILILGAMENTAAEKATFVGADMVADDGLLFYQPPNPGVEVAAAMYTFTWRQYAGNANGTRVKKYREEPKASDIIEIESAFVHKVIAADLGLFITDINA